MTLCRISIHGPLPRSSRGVEQDGHHIQRTLEQLTEESRAEARSQLEMCIDPINDHTKQLEAMKLLKDIEKLLADAARRGFGKLSMCVHHEVGRGKFSAGVWQRVQDTIFEAFDYWYCSAKFCPTCSVVTDHVVVQWCLD